MANTLRIPKAHLAMALCLPLAVILGYFLSDPLEPSSVTLVGFILAALSMPLLIKWHHPLLICCWNAALAPSFLPGQPLLWTWLAGVGLLFGILNRSVDSNRRFIDVPSIRNPLLFLGLVVAITAYFNGGLGFGIFGSSQYGGRRYFNVYAAIIGYFALTSQRIEGHRAKLFTNLFFLSMVLGIVPNIAYFLGDKAGRINLFFSPEFSSEQATVDIAGDGQGRLFGLTAVAPGLLCFLFARYGIRGVFESGKFGRMALFCVAILASLMAGFRSILILCAFLFALQFFLEGLHRTRLVWTLTGLLLLSGVIAISQSERLPFFIQRSLSFLPIEVSAEVKQSADSSLEWRLQMWKVLVPEIPKYLLKGKGFGIDPTEMYFSNDPNHQREGGFEWAIVAGDYHNGPLSLIIPLGLWGVIAFGWFLTSCLRYLYRQHQSGDPALQQINTLLLAYFCAQLIVFVFFTGAFHSELCIFTGIIGFSICLNGSEPVKPPIKNTEEGFEPSDYRDDYA